MTKKQKNIAITHIYNAIAENPQAMQDSPRFSGGITADLNFIPENILVWQSSQTLKVTDTSIHQRMILKIILGGYCTMIVDGLRIPMKKGDMICLFPFQFHSTTLECPREKYSFLAITFTEKRRDYSSFLTLKNHLLHPDPQDIANLVKMIRTFQESQQEAPEQCVFALLEILLNQRRKLQKEIVSSHEHTDLFDRICDYIRNHFVEEISLKTLADVFAVTPETVRRQFHKADSGLTPGKLIARLRLQLAIELLEHTQTSIREIAGRCGYKDPFTFSRAFKHAMGVSPLTHRNRLNKKNTE